MNPNTATLEQLNAHAAHCHGCTYTACGPRPCDLCDERERRMNEVRPRNMPARTLIRVLPDTDEGKPDFLRHYVGHVMSPFFSSSDATPPGWMEAVGQLLSCEHYPDLFAVIGYSFGNAPTIEVAKPLTFAQRVAKLLGFKLTKAQRDRIVRTLKTDKEA